MHNWVFVRTELVALIRFLSRIKLPFPSPPNACHAGYALICWSLTRGVTKQMFSNLWSSRDDVTVRRSGLLNMSVTSTEIACAGATSKMADELKGFQAILWLLFLLCPSTFANLPSKCKITVGKSEYSITNWWEFLPIDSSFSYFQESLDQTSYRNQTSSSCGSLTETRFACFLFILGRGRLWNITQRRHFTLMSAVVLMLRNVKTMRFALLH